MSNPSLIYHCDGCKAQATMKYSFMDVVYPAGWKRLVVEYVKEKNLYREEEIWLCSICCIAFGQFLRKS